jgi:hypothetical protein
VGLAVTLGVSEELAVAEMVVDALTVPDGDCEGV